MQREIEFLGDDSKDHPPSDEGRFFLQMFSQFFLGHPHVMPKWTHKKKVKRPRQRHRPSLLHNQKLKTPSHPRQRHLLSQLHKRKARRSQCCCWLPTLWAPDAPWEASTLGLWCRTADLGSERGGACTCCFGRFGRESSFGLRSFFCSSKITSCESKTGPLTLSVLTFANMLFVFTLRVLVKLGKYFPLKKTWLDLNGWWRV